MENNIKITYNLSTYEGLLQKISLKHGPNELQFVFVSDNEITFFTNLSFGYEIYDNGSLITEEQLPKVAMRYIQSDRNPVYSTVLNLTADHNYILKSWAMNDEKKIEIEGNFIIDKPPKLYESWIWNGSEWIAPVDRPSDGKGYNWDENLKLWVELQKPQGI